MCILSVKSKRICIVSLKETSVWPCPVQYTAVKVFSCPRVSSLLLCFPGQAGQCRARHGHLVAVAAAAEAVVCMWAWCPTPSPCPAHNAVIHTERGTKGPRAGRPFLQRWPRGCLLWPARNRTWQLWGRLLCKCQFTILCGFHSLWRAHIEFYLI